MAGTFSTILSYSFLFNLPQSSQRRRGLRRIWCLWRQLRVFASGFSSRFIGTHPPAVYQRPLNSYLKSLSLFHYHVFGIVLYLRWNAKTWVIRVTQLIKPEVPKELRDKEQKYKAVIKLALGAAVIIVLFCQRQNNCRRDVHKIRR